MKNQHIAEKLLDEAEDILMTSLGLIKTKTKVEVYSDARAHDDSGLDPFIVLEVIIEGEVYNRQVWI